MRGSLNLKAWLAAGVVIGCLSPGTVFAQWFITVPEEPFCPVPQYKTPYVSGSSLDGYAEPKETEAIALTDSKSWYDTPDHWLIFPLERPRDPFWDFPDYPYLPKGAVSPTE